MMVLTKSLPKKFKPLPLVHILEIYIWNNSLVLSNSPVILSFFRWWYLPIDKLWILSLLLSDRLGFLWKNLKSTCVLATSVLQQLTTELNTPVAFLTLSTLPIAGQLVTRNQWMLNICYFLKGWRAEVPRSTKSQQPFHRKILCLSFDTIDQICPCIKA